MKTKIISEVVITMTLEEARWLHNNMQNPLHCQEVEEESSEDNEMRHKFFDASDLGGDKH